MLYIGITSIHLCGKKDENMGNRFSIEELTCLHLLRCHYADICSKEENCEKQSPFIRQPS